MIPDSIKLFETIIEGYKISETPKVLRVYEFPLQKNNFAELRKLKERFEDDGVGDLSITTSDIQEVVDLSGTFKDIYHSAKGVIKIDKYTDDDLFFLTKIGFKQFLIEHDIDDIEIIKAGFLEKSFSTYGIQVIPFSSSPHKVEYPEKVPAIKFVKPLGKEGQGLLPKNILSWILNKELENFSEESWIYPSGVKLLFTLSSEFSVDDFVVDLYFRGEQHIHIKLPINEPIIINNYKVILESAKWIYLENKDIDSRHTIFNHQISLTAISKNTSADDFFSKLKDALENSELAYRYYLRSSGKELTKILIDLNKTLFDYTNKIRENTTGLVNSMWKDFTTVLGLLFLKYALQKPNLPDVFFDSLSIGLCFYLAISIFLNARLGFWFYSNIKNTINDWRYRIYSYLSDDQYEKLVENPLEKAHGKYQTTFWVILFLYILLISGILVLTFEISIIDAIIE